MDQAVVQVLSVTVAVVVGAGGILHKAGVLKFGPASGDKCQDSECQKTVRKHQERLAKGDAIIERMEKTQQDQGKKLDQVAEDVAFLRGQYER
ncbi:MAG: hypothetical protein HZB23_03510 [Deltaproteobacteria bacterium]|nr:hypothetical protein [Deltaproteobacteria bacterium]